ncbi:MAG: tetratricopeptide repeat protein [Vicinamibacterales bacterium]
MTSAPDVHHFEHHDEAYHRWHAAGVRDRVLVHVDAHHDAAWLDHREQLGIGNYVCQAVKDRLVRDVWWVVPDGALTENATRRAILAELRRVRLDYPAPRGRIVASRDRITSEWSRCRLTVCELASMPAIGEPVLLDVDTDFFVIAADSLAAGWPRVESTPWLQPSELLDRLSSAGLRFDCVTIAASVEGGFTPLAWKYLGEELAVRLMDPSDARVSGYARLTVADRLERAGRFAEAEATCRDAARALPESSAPLYRLARVLLAAGRLDEAHAAHAAAAAGDASYATPYNCPGPLLLREHRVADAERAFHLVLRLDARDAFAHLGLARVAVRRRRWSDAERHARTALSCGADLPDTHRLIAGALERQGRLGDAIEAYHRSQALALRSPAIRSGWLRSRPTSGPPVHDPDHGRIYARLASLEARRHRPREAADALRLAISTGFDRPDIRARLALLNLRRGRLRAALAESGRAFVHAGRLVARRSARTWLGTRDRIEALTA